MKSAASRKTYSTADLDLIEQYMQAQARESFWAYRQYLNPKMMLGWWQKEIAYELQQFYEDLIAGKRPYLLIHSPPQHGKTSQVVDFVSWIAGHHPELRGIYASFSERLGVRANLHLQRIYDGRKFQATFDTRIAGRANTTTASQTLRNREIIEYIGHEGYFRNTTVRGPVTGEGLDLGIVDDPLKGREEANSKTIRDKTWDWLTDDFMSRFSDHAGLLGIMTRWHIDDPFGRLIDLMGDRVKVLRYPALAETDEPHRKTGEPLFPEHKSLEFLLERKAAMHEANWQALYQQNPIIVGGNMIHEDWWRFYEALPRILWRCIYVDTAQKIKQINDYTVMQVWGKSEDGKAVMIDQIRGKWEAPELLNRARAFWDKHKAATGMGKLRAMKVEDKVSGTGLIQTLRREGVPMQDIQRSVDKVERCKDVSPSIEAGLVLLPKSAPWLSDYLEEAGQFPEGVHDDQMDPTFDAISDICIGPISSKTAGVW